LYIGHGILIPRAGTSSTPLARYQSGPYLCWSSQE
jgi:hypothetical protein